jgi:serine/threonine protein kinase
LQEEPLDLSQLSFVAPLGKGSTASVFEVAHRSSEFNDITCHLALKVMKSNRSYEKQFYRECTVLELLKDEPFVVKLVAAFELVSIPSPPEGAFFDAKTPVRALALEYCPRGELVNKLRLLLFQIMTYFVPH